MALARLQLQQADLSLASDPAGTLVRIPRLTALPITSGLAGTDVHFAGDEYPTPFDGEARTLGFDATCRYAADEQDLLLALVELIEVVARRAPDKRLLFRTHLAVVDGLDEAVAVRVRQVVRTPLGAGLFDAQFTATVVQHPGLAV